MNTIFLNLLRTSAVAGVAILALLAVSPLWNRHFGALWKKRLWCLLGAILVAGAFFRLPEGRATVEITVPQRQVAVLQNSQGTRVRMLDPDSAVMPDLVTAAPDSEAISGQSLPGAQAAAAGQVRKAVDVMTVLEILWALGAAAFLLRLAVGEFLFCRQIRRWGSTVKDKDLIEIYDNICQKMGIQDRRPALLICPGIVSPMLAGLLSPKLLLPTEDYTATEAEYILRHELGHWQSRDLWWKLLLLVANALHWFNPAAWLLRREADRDMERACDDRVMEGADDAARRAYGEVLLSAIRRGGAQPALSTCFRGSARVMWERLRNILTGAKRRGMALAVACGVLTACAVPLVSCTQNVNEEALRQPLRAYFGEHYDPETDACVFADLTHDGRQELVTVQLWADQAQAEPLSALAYPSMDEFELGRVTVLRLTEEQTVEELWTREVGSAHAGWGECFLYRQDGADYLLEYSPYSNTGASEYSYRMFWLDAEGREQTQAENAVSFVTDRPEPLPQDGDAAREEIDAFGHEIFTYLQRAQVLLAYDEAEDAGRAFGHLDTQYAVFADVAGDPAEAPEAVQAMAQDYVNSCIDAWEQDIYVQLDGEPEPDHVKILDSQVTKLQCLAQVPSPDGSGTAQVWRLSYQLKPERPEQISLAGDSVEQYGWRPVNDDSYLQPILGVWMDGKGNYSLVQWQTASGIMEDMNSSYDYYAAVLVWRQTGLWPETTRIPVLSENGWQTESWHLEQMEGASIYLPEGAETMTPARAVELERYDHAYLWQDPEGEGSSVYILHQLFGQMGPDSAREALTRAHASSWAASEPLNMSQYTGNFYISGGIVVEQVSAASGSLSLSEASSSVAGRVLWRAYTVSDGANGFWAVVTASPREDGQDLGDGWVRQSAVTFHAGTLAMGDQKVGEVSWDSAEPYEPDDGGWDAWHSAPAELSDDTVGEILADATMPDGTEVLCYWPREHLGTTIPLGTATVQQDPEAAEPAEQDGDGGYVKYWAIRRGDTLVRFCEEYSAYTEGYGAEPFQDVFGHDGFRIIAPRGAAYTAYDYYYLDETGVPRLLAACSNQVVEGDLNGDGEKELLWFYHLNEAYYAFQKEGTLYLADIKSMVEAAMPGWSVAGVSPQDGDALPIRYCLKEDRETYYDAVLRFTPEALEIYAG